MPRTIDRIALDQIFLEARSHNAWQDRDVPEATLRELLDIVSSPRRRRNVFDHIFPRATGRRRWRRRSAR